jgi:glycosyl transferase family 25
MSNHISKIIYINLEHRKDRKEQIENELNRFNLPYERYPAINIPRFGIIGCTLSHLNVLKLAKQNNYPNILILEDDFMFIIEKHQFENQLNEFFSQNIHFDVCMISYNLIEGINYKNSSLIGKVLEAQTASGYIVNNHYYDKLIKLYETTVQLLKKTGKWI